MYLHQKLGYKVHHITDNKEFTEIINEFLESNKELYYDTETTGLHIIKHTPFLVVFGYDKNIFSFDVEWEKLLSFRFLAKSAAILYAHNAKFDYHMMLNAGIDLSDCNLADSMVVARLTNYADNPMSLSLESLGQMYVDENSKFAGKIIKHLITEINRKRRNEVLKLLGNTKETKLRIDKYRKRVQFVDEPDEELEDLLKEANYEDVYKENPELMRNYAYDDIVIMKEYLDRALPVLNKVDKELVTFKRENKLITAVADMERQGFKMDIDYMLDSRKKLRDYRQKLYDRLIELTNMEFTVGQHALIKKIFQVKYKIPLANTDIKSLKKIKQMDLGDASEVANLIITLRNVDKWISTYIDGKLNNIVEINNTYRLYSNINNSGAVSGRVTSDMQQQPKYGLLNEAKEELFHPRKAIIADKDYYLFFLDFSQMELRVQAYYTLILSSGDLNMCRAYIPFECVSIVTGEDFDYKNKEHIQRWNTGEWVLKEYQDKFWEKTDLHNVTTHIAFPDIPIDSEDFKKHRKLGKMCNFLKNYQGGVNAIIEQLEVSQEIAETLDKAYYTAFPRVRDYQRWVNNQLALKGYVENLYGRRYYMKESKWYYKCSNYVIQGGCADLVKTKEIELYEFLKDKKSSMVYPIHDEICFSIHKDELDLVPELQKIMQDTLEIMPYIPMISDIEYSETSWGDKKVWGGEL